MKKRIWNSTISLVLCLILLSGCVGAVAEEFGAEGYNTDKNKERNEGAYIMDSSYSDMDTLLNRSRSLADRSGKGGAVI